MHNKPNQAYKSNQINKLRLHTDASCIFNREQIVFKYAEFRETKDPDF